VFAFPRNVVPPRPVVGVGLAWRVSRGGGSGKQMLEWSSVAKGGRYLPLGRVRKGFPFAEPVSVAVARLFWNSLARQSFVSQMGEHKYIDTLIVEPILNRSCCLGVVAFKICNTEQNKSQLLKSPH